MTAPRLRLSPPLAPSVYVRRPRPLPFPLREPNVSLFARGRHALWYGVQALELRPGDEVLAPAYHCGTEIEVLARAGLVCRFYEATDTLEPNEPELEALLSPRTRALLLIHYFGFPQDAPRWRAWCDARGLLLLEDCAPAWLASVDGHPVGTFGHLAVFSFYKTLPLPDGAALLVRSRPPRPRATANAGLFAIAKGHVKWTMARSATVDRLLAALEDEYVPDLALGDPDSAPSRGTRFLLPRLARPGAAERRRANYARLLAEFAPHVPVPFDTLPAGACPLIFPVETRPGERLAERLEREGVPARRYWPILHPLLPQDAFPRAVTWHERFVALPVHQGLRASDLARVAGALRRALGASSADAGRESPETVG
jgi:dTDP-4-amino-4,6-dideoxygalactose transaminase